MKSRFPYPFFFAAMMLLPSACSVAQKTLGGERHEVETDNKEYSKNTLIVYVDANTGKEPLFEFCKAKKFEVIYNYSNISGAALKIPENVSIEKAIAHLKKVKGVVGVERDSIMKLQ